MRMIFVNQPVKDVQASRAFFGALGFTFNEQFCDESTACLVIEENIFAMLIETEKFKGFINGEIADPATTETLTALSSESREAVDELCDKALAAGAETWKEPMDMGFMYGRSFRDLDGHVWETMWMDPAAAAGGEQASEGAAA